MLERLEARADRDEERYRERKREEESRLRAWEAAMDRAKDRLVDEHRKDWLLRQIERRRLSEQARASVVATTNNADLSEDDRLWLKWISAHADSIDPVGHSLVPPPPPEASPEPLKPYLERGSPYGPDRGW